MQHKSSLDTDQFPDAESMHKFGHGVWGVEFDTSCIKEAYASFDRTDFMFEVIATYQDAPQRIIRLHINSIFHSLQEGSENKEPFVRTLWECFDNSDRLLKLSCCIYNRPQYYPLGLPKWFDFNGKIILSDCGTYLRGEKLEQRLVTFTHDEEVEEQEEEENEQEEQNDQEDHEKEADEVEEVEEEDDDSNEP